MRRVVLLALLAVALTVVLGAGVTSHSEALNAGGESVRSGIDHATVAARGSVETPRAGLAILTAVVVLVAMAWRALSPVVHARCVPVVTARSDRSRAPPPI